MIANGRTFSDLEPKFVFFRQSDTNFIPNFSNYSISEQFFEVRETGIPLYMKDSGNNIANNKILEVRPELTQFVMQEKRAGYN